MIAEERRKIILERIQDNKSVSVQELSKEFGITGVTIRRDLDLLDQQGLVKRSHGGAVILDQNVGVESGFEARRGRKMEIKGGGGWGGGLEAGEGARGGARN